MDKKPNVDVMFRRGEYPDKYCLGVDGWAFSEEKLSEVLVDGTRKLLTLDLSISPYGFVELVNKGDKKERSVLVEKNYDKICPNNCPGCFEREAEVRNPLLSFAEIKDIVDQAVELGLESVKFLGPGELITNPDFWEILDYFKEKNVKMLIFTKGEILGDDKLALKYQKMSSEKLTMKLCSYSNVRILIDCRSFDEEKSNKLTRSEADNSFKARNRAIELLVRNKMNADPFCQRMSLQTNPVTQNTMSEILDIFKWGTERNIPVCVTATMVSGRGHKLEKQARNLAFEEKLIHLYTDIYLHIIDLGIVKLDRLTVEGISPYAGTAPCNQLSCGMFIRKDGVVLRCPGNDSPEFEIVDDVREKPLKEIWKNSVNYNLGPVFNNHCVKDGFSLPVRLYEEVMRRVIDTLKIKESGTQNIAEIEGTVKRREILETGKTQHKRKV
ncbi:radical SAM protein [Candidatus Micrarchaeota archaeon]|nr:radical SAM protein [Candidatus Micrarchaeota archaeon]